MRRGVGSIKRNRWLLCFTGVLASVQAMMLAQASLAQSAADGAGVYASNCAACHQLNGQGVAGVFPPLVGHVPTLLARPSGRDYLIRVVLFGLTDTITINGQNYSGAMPPWVSLSDASLAAVLNHVAIGWDQRQRLPADFKPFRPDEIAAARVEKLAASDVHAMRKTLLPAAQTPAENAAATRRVTYTAEQAAQGKSSYVRNCADCHGSTLDNGEFGGAPLRGAWFDNKWGNSSVANLYAFTKAKMPPDRPGALSDKVYADLVAYILSVNGYKAGEQALPEDPKAQQPLSLKRQ